jgi:hypothetical protein
MIRKIGVLALLVCLLMAILAPGQIQAQSELAIVDSSAVAVFPYQLSFNLSASSNVNITDIRLCYSVDRISLAQVISEGYVKFTPATTVDVSWNLEMVKVGGLPPGASVTYWWRVKDASGKMVESAPTQVCYEDARYSWHSLTEGKVTLYWYEGDDAFAQELMSAVQEALGRLADDTGAELEKPAKLYIYATQQDLLGAMVHPQEWTGGAAYTRHGIIVLGIAADQIDWGSTIIAHELAHLVIHQVTLNPYNNLPTWLDEGLAMHNEGPLDPAFTSYLMWAIDEDRLISVQSLCSEFSAIPQQAYLSYAQSYSLVEYLITTYGQEKMLELLNTFREGSGYDDALEKVYGFDMDGLDSLWQDYVSGRYQSVELVPALESEVG